MPRLGVVMIVKNEAGCIGDCLDSVRSIADAITVADTGSTDDTIAIARSHGAAVTQIPWHDDFAEARNRLLAAATGDWLLHLDADELVDPEAGARIRAVVDADGNGADAIEVVLANYCDDFRSWRWTPTPHNPWARGYAGYVATTLLRLFRNGRGFEYRDPVHENITESVRERGGIVRSEPILIHHYGYACAESRAAEKRALYLDIARRNARQHANDPKAWHDRAELEFAAGNTIKAEEAARHALEIDIRHLGAAVLLGNILLNTGRIDEAQTLFEGFEAEDVPHLKLALGAIAYKQGRLDDARRRLEAVVARQPEAILARCYLSRVLDCIGDREGARRQLEAAALSMPSLDEPQTWLRARALREEGERKLEDGGAPIDVLKSLVGALQLDAEDPITHNAIGLVLATLGDTERACDSFERALLLTRGMTEAQRNLDELSSPMPPETLS